MDRLLARVRRALAGAARAAEPPRLEPAGPGGSADLVAAFAAAFERAGGRLVGVADRAAAERWLATELADGTWVGLEDEPGEAALRTAEVGVDRADLLVAETGTVVRSYATRQQARISLVPPVSVFLADTTLLVPDLPTALDRLAPLHRGGRAFTLFVTGPSRTADIEKRLVIPAHGPREVVVLLAGARNAGPTIGS